MVKLAVNPVTVPFSTVAVPVSVKVPGYGPVAVPLALYVNVPGPVMKHEYSKLTLAVIRSSPVKLGGGAGAIVIEQEAPATEVVTSCTNTVKVVVPVEVGVPVIAPVAEFRVRPAGSALAP